MINNNLINDFISVLKNRLLNKESIIDIKSDNKNDFHVYIDGISAGILSNKQDEDIKKCPYTLCYFLPNILYFDLIDKTSINGFVNVTQKLSMSFDDILDPDNPERPKDRKLRDFGFDLNGKNVYHRFKFDNEFVCFKENLSITFKVIKQNGVVYIIDNFKTSILSSSIMNFKLLGITEIKNLNDNINMVVLKNNDNYTLTHQYQDYLPTIVFDIDTIPNFDEIISFVVDYTLMIKHNIELPSINEFNKNKKRYKDLIEMTLIS